MRTFLLPYLTDLCRDIDTPYVDDSCQNILTKWINIHLCGAEPNFEPSSQVVYDPLSFGMIPINFMPPTSLLESAIDDNHSPFWPVNMKKIILHYMNEQMGLKCCAKMATKILVKCASCNEDVVSVLLPCINRLKISAEMLYHFDIFLPSVADFSEIHAWLEFLRLYESHNINMFLKKCFILHDELWKEVCVWLAKFCGVDSLSYDVIQRIQSLSDLPPEFIIKYKNSHHLVYLNCLDFLASIAPLENWRSRLMKLILIFCENRHIFRLF